MVALLLIAIGGAFGGVCRYLLSYCIDPIKKKTFPWDTFMANASGSLLLGLLFGSGLADLHEPTPVYFFAGIGFCGGLTTFSSFSLQTLGMISEGRFKDSALKVTGSVILCVTLVWLGMVLGEGIYR